MSSDTLNKQTVKANLKSLPKDAYQLLPVDAAEPIREWVKSQGIPYLIGHAYYQTDQDRDNSAAKEHRGAGAENKQGVHWTAGPGCAWLTPASSPSITQILRSLCSLPQ